jgi:signal peptidase I
VDPEVRHLPPDVETTLVDSLELAAAGGGPGGPVGPFEPRVVKRVAAVAGDRTPAGVDGAGAGAGGAQPVVPAGKLVLLGDNPSASSDSRHYGYVSTDVVIGILLRHL